MSKKSGKRREIVLSDNHSKSGEGIVVTTSEASTSSITQNNTVYEETRDGFILGFNVIREISEADQLLAPLKSICLLINRGLETTRSINSNKKAWSSLASRLQRQLGNLENYQRRLKGHRCNLDLTPLGPLKEYTEVIQEVLSHAVKAEKRSKNVVRRIIRSNIDAEEFIDWTLKIDDAYKQFMVCAQVSLLPKLIVSEKEAMEVLQWIQVAQQGLMIEEIREDVQYIKESRGPPKEDEEAFLELAYGNRVEVCQQGTRTEVLKRIRDWVDDDRTEEQIFWLSDLAGTGKSTIAATVANECIESNRLAGRFFFTPNSKASSSLKDFCTTVARDMSSHHNSLQFSVKEAIKATPGTIFSVRQQFSRILVDPLKQVDKSVVFIFDALDNCDEEGHRMLLELLLRFLPSIPKVKAFLTSRPLESIKAFLNESPMVTGNDVELYPIRDKSLNPDIAIYIDHNLYLRYLTPDQRLALARRSNGLFIWAATACRLFQNTRRPTEILNLLLYSKSADNLDGLYLEILKAALVDRRAHKSFMSVLQVVICAIEPISISTIQIFLPQNDSVNAFIKDLGSVLKDGTVYRPIHVIHPTFREYLTEGTRVDHEFLIHSVTSHSLLARACLSCLLSSLQYNIAGQSTAEFNDEMTRKELESNLSRSMFGAMFYAARYWSHHILSGERDPELDQLLSQFMKEKLLNWMEFLSICDLVPLGIESISSLVAFSKSSAEGTSNILTRIDETNSLDALRFMQRHQEIIMTSALQIYSSALPFTPHSTFIFQNYYLPNCKHIPYVLAGLPETWESHLILSGHMGHIASLSFSPNGRLLASIGATDYTLRIWDTVSGTYSDPQGQSMWTKDKVNIAVFSPDGQVVITDSEKNDLLLWDPKTLTQKGPRLVGHENTITVITLSPEGSYVASGSVDTTIRIWDLSLGECISVIHSGHPGQINQLAFSPNGTVLAAMDDKEISLWDVMSLKPLLPHSKLDSSNLKVLEFVSNGGFVLVGGDDGGLYLLVTGQDDIIKLEGHSTAITCCATTEDGSRFASADANGNVIVWDADSRTPVIGATQVHFGQVEAIAFTLDDLKIITISRDDTFKVWDITNGQHMTSRLGADGVVSTSLAISKNGEKVAIGWWSGVLSLFRVEDAVAETAAKSITHTSRVNCLAVSSDYAVIASAGKDNMVILWSATTGECLGKPLAGHSKPITCLQFCHGGQYIASGSEDCSIRVWRVVDGSTQTSALTRHSDRITCLAFSADAQFLISGSQDESTCIWNVNTGQLVGHPLTGHTSWVTCVIVAESVGRIITGSRDTTIRQWDLFSGKEYADQVIRCNNPVDSIVVSPDGNYLAYVTSSVIVGVQDLNSNTPILSTVTGTVWARAPYLYFSDDSTHVWVGKKAWRISKGVLSESKDVKALSHPLSNIMRNPDNWISLLQSDKKLFKLPHDINVSKWLAYGTFLAIGTWSGRVLIIDCRNVLTDD